MLYLTHGAQYCLWYGMKPNVSKAAEQFGLPATSTHKDVYEALLCSIDIPFPVNITLDNKTKFQDMDLYVELLLSCSGLRRSVNMMDVENVYKNFFIAPNDIDKQKWHCKMVLWFLLKRMAKEARTPSPPLSPPPSSKQLQKIKLTKLKDVQQLAFQYLRDECGLVAYACFPKVGVQKIDSLDTIVQATEASDSSGIFNLLENSDAFLRIDNSRWFLKPDDIHEFTDFEKQHVLFRYNNWNGEWGNQLVWALAPVFEKVVEVYNDDEQCKRRCGYNAGCEFTLNTALKIYSQHQYGTLAEALKACKKKPNITGFDCVNGKCTPSTNTKVLFPISRYGTPEAALEHCQRYCEGTAGYTCTGKGECIFVKENATFPLSNLRRESTRGLPRTDGVPESH